MVVADDEVDEDVVDVLVVAMLAADPVPATVEEQAAVRTAADRSAAAAMPRRRLIIGHLAWSSPRRGRERS